MIMYKSEFGNLGEPMGLVGSAVVMPLRRQKGKSNCMTVACFFLRSKNLISKLNFCIFTQFCNIIYVKNAYQEWQKTYFGQSMAIDPKESHDFRTHFWKVKIDAKNLYAIFAPFYNSGTYYIRILNNFFEKFFHIIQFIILYKISAPRECFQIKLQFDMIYS